jgi:hypothetical protein
MLALQEVIINESNNMNILHKDILMSTTVSKRSYRKPSRWHISA